MEKFKTFSELRFWAIRSEEVNASTYYSICDCYYYLQYDTVDDCNRMYPELSSTFLDFYPDGMTEQEAIDFFTEFIKRKGKYVQIN